MYPIWVIYIKSSYLNKYSWDNSKSLKENLYRQSLDFLLIITELVPKELKSFILCNHCISSKRRDIG